MKGPKIFRKQAVVIKLRNSERLVWTAYS